MAERPNLDDYVDVAERLVEFRTKHPEGSLQQVDVQFIDFAGASWVIYTAAAYRGPEDPRPGHGTAWEPVPGKTPFTRDSELQNAETAAWGRAIMAALAADARRGGIASQQEVRNARAREDHDRDEEARLGGPMESKTRAYMFVLFAKKGPVDPDEQRAGIGKIIGRDVTTRGDLTEGEARAVIAVLEQRPDLPPVAPPETMDPNDPDDPWHPKGESV
jgi:hypothetical protein